MNIQLVLASQRIPPAAPPSNSILIAVASYPFPVFAVVPASNNTAAPAIFLRT